MKLLDSTGAELPRAADDNVESAVDDDRQYTIEPRIPASHLDRDGRRPPTAGQSPEQRHRLPLRETERALAAVALEPTTAVRATARIDSSPA
jgi:hypothetical protein